MFSAVRRLLFMLPPERAHDLTFGSLDQLFRLGGGRLFPARVEAPQSLMGLEFANAVGLSAGLDKNGDHIRSLAGLGFGFIELGTVTPVAQPGNPAPRVFRLPAHQALINRLGFNNEGLAALIRHLEDAAPEVDVPIGVNIGKNRDTPLERATDDYLACLEAVHGLADYVVVNLSSPNTPGLRSLQAGENLTGLVQILRERADALNATTGRRVPLVVKIAPDLDDDALRWLVDALLAAGVDGLTATNTTVDHSAVAGARHAAETGGLSGSPLRQRATEVIATVRAHAGPELPIIGVGGIMTGEDAVEKIQAGANLVQVYTGLIYKGPALIRNAARAIRDAEPGA
ncbi:quinone-dependent dihydroorotate dehydrogenase [Spiribacter aquaticus]|uniref:Dihydroorotate dehydrogenase (quinone) n=1 Tax=Spiribacter aquaticus TaxID=1935996 RepID=A0A557RF37_9GAMM|nr:dihydroorotate dehydrogenase (quinone) [Spiribacter roseus]TVO63753.1 quinone-dependent dihydroorotate dehydrogenase [Spiribacter aquaticus]